MKALPLASVVMVADPEALPVRGVLSAAGGLTTLGDASVWCEAQGEWRALRRDLVFPSSWIQEVHRCEEGKPWLNEE